MDRQTSTPGPEIGWVFGAAGFIATVLVGWLIGAGVGFVLFMVVFWAAVGSLFAFLVERSTIEEHDRVDELQNTRLATLAPARAPRPDPGSRPADDARRAAVDTPSLAVDARREGRSVGPAPAEDRPRPTSPREYREARAEAARKDHAAA